MLGKAATQDYKSNVDTALEKLRIQGEAQKDGYAARRTAEAGMARLSQRRADADFELQQQQLDLYKNGSCFNKAYDMYLSRMIKKDKFRDLTGIEVKNLPVKKKKAKRAVKPLIIQLDQTDPATKLSDPNYTLISSVNPDTSVTKYLVDNKLISDAGKTGIQLKDNSGRIYL